MIGFELDINNDKISAALAKGIVSIIITKLSNEFGESIELNFTGGTSVKIGEEQETIDWYSSNLKIGDELTIKVKDISANSTPLEVRRSIREPMIEQKLKTYNALKEELEDQGLI